MPVSGRSPGPQIMHRASSALQGPSPSNLAAGWGGLAIMSVEENMRLKHQANRNACPCPFRQQKPNSVQSLAESKLESD